MSIVKVFKQTFLIGKEISIHRQLKFKEKKEKN